MSEGSAPSAFAGFRIGVSAGVSGLGGYRVV